MFRSDGQKLFPALSFHKIMCRSCNHYKSALKPEEFRKYLSGIPKRLMRDSIPFQVGERFGIVRIVTDDVTFYYEKIKNKNRNRED